MGFNLAFKGLMCPPGWVLLCLKTEAEPAPETSCF